MKPVVLTMVVLTVVATACGGTAAPQSIPGTNAGRTAGSTYYVSPSGSDRNRGTSPAKAWRTLNAVNRRRLHPGDTVLFKAGGVWRGALEPRGHGTSSHPITFGAYGAGRWVIDGASREPAGIRLGANNDYTIVKRAEIRGFDSDRSAIFLDGASHLRLSAIDAHDNSNGLWSSSHGAPSTDVLVSGSTFSGYPSGIQLYVGNPHSSGWRIVRTNIENAGDSCVIDVGGESLYRSVRVHHCGYAAAAEVPWPRHGIYAKGPDITVVDSRIWDIAHGVGGGQCLSMREGGVVQGNALYDCDGGIGFFDYTRRRTQTLTIRRNQIWGFSTWGIYLDTVRTNFDNHLGVPNHAVDFAISNNTVVSTRSPAVGVSFGGAAKGYGFDLHLTNNIVAGQLELALSAFEAGPNGNGSFSGSNNIYWNTDGPTTLKFRGRVISQTTVPGDRGSVVADPGLQQLSRGFGLQALSPAVDFGTARVPGGRLIGSCTGGVLSYCGKAPDAGALESGCCGTKGATTGSANATTGAGDAHRQE